MTRRSGLGRRFVFVDTSAFVALAVKQDQSHAAAVAVATRLGERQPGLLTTNVVLMETHALLLRSLGGRRALAELQRIENGSVVVVQVNQADEREARQLLLRYADRDFSLIDALSFVVMGRLGVLEAFTFDHHFRQYGLTVLDSA